MSSSVMYLGDDLHYPHLKSADFGLSMITSLRNYENKMKWHGNGTPSHFPPEQRADKITNPDYYPFEETLFVDDESDLQENHAYTLAGNCSWLES